MTDKLPSKPQKVLFEARSASVVDHSHSTSMQTLRQKNITLSNAHSKKTASNADITADYLQGEFSIAAAN